MLQTLLTLMLFIMPFLISQREIPRPGLHTGLWVSLFFWGRVHAMFSILTFGVSAVYYVVQRRDMGAGAPAGEAGVPGPASAHLWVPRTGARPLTGCLAVVMIFCAFGNVCTDYGAALGLDSMVQEMALLLGFAGSLTGPVLFGLCSDKTGPFAAFMLLLSFGLGAVGFTALSPDFPYIFPFASLLMQAVIGGSFTLMPQLLLRFYGRPQLDLVLPFLLLFLAGLWTAASRFYSGADALPQDYLLAMAFLLVMALPLAKRAWRRRLGVL